MTYEQMIRKIQTAGSWFTGVFMEEILRAYPKIHDDANEKMKFIEYMHSEYGKNLDYEFDSTKTKCYAIIAIIREHRVLDALDYVIQSNDKKVDPDAKENAMELLDKIVKDEVILP